MENINLIDEIERRVFSGQLMIEIKTVFTEKLVRKAVNDLKILDEERYNKLKKQIESNAHNKFVENAKKSTFNHNPYHTKEEEVSKIVNKLVANEINLFEASQELNIHLLQLFLNLIEINDEELKEKLKPILEMYGFDKKMENSRSLSSYSIELQKEIILMALTYRVSFKTIAEMFHTTMEDVIRTFLHSKDLLESLDLLFEETINEDEINEKVGKAYAKKYWKERNELIKALNEAKKSGDEEKIQEIKMEIKKLHSKIDDSFILEKIENNTRDLKQEEKDRIAWFPLKYNLSIIETRRRLHMHVETIMKYQEDLAKRNMIFCEKLDFYKKRFQLVRTMYTTEGENISRGYR